MKILERLREEKEMRLKGGLYHKTQVAITYNSNHIEGSTLSEEQTRMIFEEDKILSDGAFVEINDIIETKNHFKCFDYVIENAEKPLSEDFIKTLHKILKTGTSDANKNWFKVGEYKSRPNEVGGFATTAPNQVAEKIQALLNQYNSKKQINFEDIIKFHKNFEDIHPFQDGNGRVGRLIMFKECLKNGITPFIIQEKNKFYYYRGLHEWQNEKGYLIETCRFEQDIYQSWVDYFFPPH